MGGALTRYRDAVTPNRTMRVVDGPRAGDVVEIVGEPRFPIRLLDAEASAVYDQRSPKPRMSRSSNYWLWDKRGELVLTATARRIPMELLERLSK